MNCCCDKQCSFHPTEYIYYIMEKLSTESCENKIKFSYFSFNTLTFSNHEYVFLYKKIKPVLSPISALHCIHNKSWMQSKELLRIYIQYYCHIMQEYVCVFASLLPPPKRRDEVLFLRQSLGVMQDSPLSLSSMSSGLKGQCHDICTL